MSRSRVAGIIVLLLLAAAALTAGCATASPSVKVIGATEARNADAARIVVLFLEVQNPTGSDIRLSKLSYQLDAKPWLTASGTLPLSRAIAARSAAVLEIPVPMRARGDLAPAHEIPYSLRGVLTATAGTVENRWKVAAHGEIAPDLATGARARTTLLTY